MVKNLQKKYDGFELKNLNFAIQPGEYFVILGPSGAGKTLILEMLARLRAPDSGRITGLDGQKISLIYQDYMLFPHLDVFDNIGYGLKIKKMDKEKIKAEAEKIAALVGISHLLHRQVIFPFRRRKTENSHCPGLDFKTGCASSGRAHGCLRSEH